MKRSAIYRKAARLIASNQERWSCCAVNMAALGDANKRSPESLLYAEMFALPAEELPVYWRGSPEHRIQGSFAEAEVADHDVQALRVLALCFMAAIAKSEGQ